MGQGWIKFHLTYARLSRQRNREEYAVLCKAATAISEKMLFADGVRKTCTGADILLPAREAAFNRPVLLTVGSPPCRSAVHLRIKNI